MNKEPRYLYTPQDSDISYCGGGIILYDNNGFWVVNEKDGLTDMGGKYHYNDGDIYGCISRELAEETFHTIEITSSVLRTISKKITLLKSSKDVLGNPKTYMCIFVHLDHLSTERCNIDREQFHAARIETLKNNINYKHLYPQTDLIYINFNDLENVKENFSYRLKTIIHEHGWI